jgi:predicted transcriptional regulator
MKYRSKTDIIGNILEAVNSRGGGYIGLTKSKIMYTVFLSYAQLQGYLSDLVGNGLIEKYKKELERGKENKDKDKGKQRPSNYYYRITDKGRRFLQIYGDLSEMMIA